MVSTSRYDPSDGDSREMEGSVESSWKLYCANPTFPARSSALTSILWLPSFHDDVSISNGYTISSQVPPSTDIWTSFKLASVTLRSMVSPASIKELLEGDIRDITGFSESIVKKNQLEFILPAISEASNLIV